MKCLCVGGPYDGEYHEVAGAYLIALERNPDYKFPPITDADAYMLPSTPFADSMREVRYRLERFQWLDPIRGTDLAKVIVRHVWTCLSGDETLAKIKAVDFSELSE